MKFAFRLYILIIHCFLLCVNNKAVSQNIVVKHYSVTEGLPSSECYSVIQDSRNFLWIATDAGVAKYDGYKFVTYNSSKGLPDNTVFKIHEDAHGRIWFSTYSGKMAYYSYETDSIHTIPANKALNNLVKFLPADFCFDNKDTLWVSLQLQGLVKVIPPLYKNLIHYELPSQAYFIKEVSNNAFIYGVDAKQMYTNLTNRTLSFYFTGSNNKYWQTKFHYDLPWSVNAISAIKTGEKNYLFSNHNTVFKVSDNSVKQLFNSNLSIINIYKDSKNKVWLNTRGGTLLFNDDQLKKIASTFFSDAVVSSVIEDTDHGYWFTTTTNGIYYIPSLNFKYFNKDCGLTSDKVYDFALLNNKLYCTVNDKKLNVLDLTSNTFSYGMNSGDSHIFSFDNKLVSNFNKLGSQIIDPDNNSYVSIKDKRNKADIMFKKTIEYDSDFLIGFNQVSEVFKINKKTGIANLLTTIPFRIFSLYKDKHRVFIGTKQGLYKLESNKLFFLGDHIPLLANRIEAITGIDNTLFIATKGFGVLCYRNNKIIGCFNETNGLASDICKCIIKDSENNVWVGTNRGISRLRVDKNGNYSCATLNLSNGLVSNEINQIVEYKRQLYFATNSGLGIVDLNEAFDKHKFIPVYIEHFLVNNIKHDHNIKQELKYNENFIAINYKGVYLKNEGDITYKYKLEGLDASWTSSKNTYIQYTTLPPGQYKFIVYALNSNGGLCSQPATILFNIQIPFWQTGWFYTLIIIFVSVIIYFLYKRRVNTIKKMEAQKTLNTIKIAESELKALRSQMNPHFIFNAINSIQNFVIKNESIEAQKYLTKFSKLIRSVLENSKNETILLTKEIESLQLYLELEALRASFQFDYEINITENIKGKPIYIPTMLIQPYIENAILHGLLPLTERKGKIDITFDEKDSTLICKIDDNGIGRLKAQEIKQKKNLNHVSMGMTVASERVDNLNKSTSAHTSIEISDKYNHDQSMGTLVTITIKYNI